MHANSYLHLAAIGESASGRSVISPRFCGLCRVSFLSRERRCARWLPGFTNELVRAMMHRLAGHSPYHQNCRRRLWQADRRIRRTRRVSYVDNAFCKWRNARKKRPYSPRAKVYKILLYQWLTSWRRGSPPVRSNKLLSDSHLEEKGLPIPTNSPANNCRISEDGCGR